MFAPNNIRTSMIPSAPDDKEDVFHHPYLAFASMACHHQPKEVFQNEMEAHVVHARETDVDNLNTQHQDQPLNPEW